MGHMLFIDKIIVCYDVITSIYLSRGAGYGQCQLFCVTLWLILRMHDFFQKTRHAKQGERFFRRNYLCCFVNSAMNLLPFILSLQAPQKEHDEWRFLFQPSQTLQEWLYRCIAFISRSARINEYSWPLEERANILYPPAAISLMQFFVAPMPTFRNFK
jgi:hypothetical protein